MDTIVKRIESLIGHQLNAAFLNCYLNGKQHVNWHQDAVEELVPGSVIVTLSLGSSRLFQLRHISETEMVTKQHEVFRKRKEGKILSPEDKKMVEWVYGKDPETNLSIMLEDGDLVIMGGTLQKFWKHRIPPEENCDQMRISINLSLHTVTNV